MNWPMEPDAAISASFTRTDFSCPCCGVLELDAGLLVGLEILVKLVGPGRLKIRSGFRCRKHNATIKGAAPGSQHIFGRAADVRAVGISQARLFNLAETIWCFREGGMSKNYRSGIVHVDVRGVRARW